MLLMLLPATLQMLQHKLLDIRCFSMLLLLLLLLLGVIAIMA